MQTFIIPTILMTIFKRYNTINRQKVFQFSVRRMPCPVQSSMSGPPGGGSEGEGGAAEAHHGPGGGEQGGGGG